MLHYGPRAFGFDGWLSAPSAETTSHLIHKGEQAAKKYRGAEINREASLTLSYQRERGPIVGMRVALSKFDHGALQSERLGKALLQAGVERNHKFLGTAVMDVPETQDQ